MKQQVVLVDQKDHALGSAELLRAHSGNGMLHRAVSVLAYRIASGKTEILLQKRSSQKLLWPGYWTNTVCTHPKERETYKAAARRRLKEEMGIQASTETPLIRVCSFIYQASYSPEYGEYELDTVYLLSWNGVPKINPLEASASRWAAVDEVQFAIENSSDRYTPWFQKILKETSVQDYFRV